MTEDEMVGWHHRLNRHEFEQTPGDGEGQGGLECCSPCGCKESDTTQQLKNDQYAACFHVFFSEAVSAGPSLRQLVPDTVLESGPSGWDPLPTRGHQVLTAEGHGLVVSQAHSKPSG